MRPATFTFAVLTGIAGIAGFVACVGDDPGSGATDGGGSSGTTTSSGGSSGTSSSGGSSGASSSGGSSGTPDSAVDECEAGAKDCVGNQPRTCVAGKWEGQVTCTGDDVKYRCEGGECVGAPSCVGLLSSNCGSNPANCCKSPKVDGATFTRDFTPNGAGQSNLPATISSYRLDQFEVTVERFRNFIVAGFGTTAKPPATGSGAHPKIASSGWQAAWNASLPADSAALKAALLSCESRQPPTYADANNIPQNKLPLNCATWFEAFAFCIWDGGRLPTAAELNLAHRGGVEARKYPWGAAAIDPTRAFYCEADSGTCATTPIGTFPAVGSKPNGAGRWGQLDLLGSLREYVLDYRTPIPDPCTDCAQLDPAQTSARGNWGWSWADPPNTIDTFGLTTNTSARTSAGGFRCARDL